MSQDSEYQMTVDGRDLFDVIRGAVKSAIEDFGTDDRSTDCWLWQEATQRTIEAMNIFNAWRGASPEMAEANRSAVRIFDARGRSIEVLVSAPVARQIEELRAERDHLFGRIRSLGEKSA
ncbi:hypothetical protein [Paraburkholderia sp. Cpub6]|uniref:hypothetical protein n=1 Tax=Paraburkholderia sp. Cpub6 TaxID=2723094 RepID=UPI0016221B32|nr:hypothetical protein [Paraburkholderia sp. Cpub6]MBB5462892.1 hypothetical protein [Paraburkholderia sp. Cpub6]